MNGIIQNYQAFKNCKTFEDLVAELGSCGMPILHEYPKDLPLLQKCELAGRDWIRLNYAKSGRPRATVSDVEFDSAAQIAAEVFYSVLAAGDVKTLYLVTKEASDFIECTAFGETLDEKFFEEHFARPVVLYAGDPNELLSGVTAISIVYNDADATLDCLISCKDAVQPSRELCCCYPVEQLCGIFTKTSVVLEEVGDGTREILRQGFVENLGELEDRFYSALLFAFKFILLRQCDKQTIVVERQYKKKGNAEKQKRVFGLLNQQKVSLTTAYRTVMQSYKPDEQVCLDKEGKTLRATKVVGFMRRQHYGPGRSLVKMVYIDAHESHSWMKDGIRIVKVVR